jgi:hypothetical protein
MSRRIAILFHRNTRLESLRYFVITHVAECWREQGFDVRILRGTKEYVPADILFVHVDLTVVPDEYLEFARRYPIIINGAVKDIRKTGFSQIRLRPGDDYRGPVFLKSNLNYGGLPEDTLRFPWAWWQSPPVQKMVRAFGAVRRLPFRRSDQYRIFPDLKAVPRRWINHPNLIVEKFLPETENGIFIVRAYCCLGDQFHSTRRCSADPVIKARVDVRNEPITPHPGITDFRRRMHLQYGKLDYVVHNEELIVLDVNKTIGASRFHQPATIRKYAAGIHSFLA